MQCENAGRRLTYASSAIACLINLTILLLIQLLPEPSSQVSRHVFLYAGFSALMSIAGLYGAFKRKAHWISVFANYLLLDAIIFTVPRILLLAYTTTIPYNFCSHAYGGTHPDQIAFRASPAYTHHQPRRIEKFEQWASQAADLSHGHCLAISWVVVGLLAASVFALTIGQWVAVFKVRSYGKLLTSRTGQPRGLKEVGGAEEGKRRHVRFELPSMV